MDYAKLGQVIMMFVQTICLLRILKNWISDKTKPPTAQIQRIWKGGTE